jgi:hypothetical protein
MFDSRQIPQTIKTALRNGREAYRRLHYAARSSQTIRAGIAGETVKLHLGSATKILPGWITDSSYNASQFAELRVDYRGENCLLPLFVDAVK